MRRVIIVLVGAACALALLPVGPAHAADSHRYVAAGVSSLTGGLGGDATAPADLDTIRTTSPFDRITITVADDVITDGTIRVIINDRTPGARYLCVQAGTPTEIGGLRPGEPIAITIAGMTFAGGCDSGGTTGTLTIS